MDRRDFLTAGALATGGIVMGGMGLVPQAAATETGQAAPKPYALPPLPYAYDALEPHIDQKTMTIHHDKHHAGYTRGLNKTLATLEAARNSGDFSNIQQLSRALAFHMGGYINHSIFWKNMAPAGRGGGEPSGALADAITRDFGSFAAFEKHFSMAATKVEGGGWGVLGWNPYLNRLLVVTMMNQQDLIGTGVLPLLMLDVWEHAYYIKYQNRRGDYVKAWWYVVNWKDVAERYERAVAAKV